MDTTANHSCSFDEICTGSNFDWGFVLQEMLAVPLVVDDRHADLRKKSLSLHYRQLRRDVGVHISIPKN